MKILRKKKITISLAKKIIRMKDNLHILACQRNFAPGENIPLWLPALGLFTPSQAQPGHQRTHQWLSLFWQQLNPAIHRPHHWGQGNKAEQDKASRSAPGYPSPHVHHLPQPCTILTLSKVLYTRSWLCRTDASRQQQGRAGLLKASSQPVSAPSWGSFGAQGHSWKILVPSSRG